MSGLRIRAAVIAAVTTVGLGLTAGVVAAPAQAQTTTAAREWKSIAIYHDQAACVAAASSYSRSGLPARCLKAPYATPGWALQVME